MLSFTLSSPVKAPLSHIKEHFTSDLLLKLSPPFPQVSLERFDGCKKDDQVILKINLLLTKLTWSSVITAENDTPEEWYFVDEGHQIPWPLSSWKHIHRVISLGENSSKIVDDISFECVYSWMNPLFYPILWSSFSVRPSRYKKFFEGP